MTENSTTAVLFLSQLTDAGGIIWINGKPHRVPGWGEGVLEEVQLAAEVVQLASKLKTPGLAESVSGHLVRFIDEQVGAYSGARETTVIG